MPRAGFPRIAFVIWKRIRIRRPKWLGPNGALQLDSTSGPGTTTPQAALRSLGWVDVPAAEAIVGVQASIRGWALDRTGIGSVEIRHRGKCHRAHYGLRRDDVAGIHPGYPDSASCGFEFEGSLDPGAGPPGATREQLDVVAIARDGRETLLSRRSVIASGVPQTWRDFAAADLRSTRAFFVLPALSGVPAGGAEGLDTRYTPYLSPTTRIGMRVPILYLRTTLGAAGDYAFDPDFDVSRTHGARAIADDSLSAVLADAARRRLPVLVTLNGGIWADASGSAPERDVNDHLEEDPANCQWNERDEVMPDDWLKHLPGSQDAPELARALTLNVYAGEARRYKKRNLQQAGGYLVAFMREHPELFVGVNLDPDVYINPFFSEAQWYDYNPGTLRQFRHWLAGTGPYAGAPEPGIPDLSCYCRESPLTLGQVSARSQRDFLHWEDVDPPRRFSRDAASPYWEDPWVREWERFRRHLVSLHYDELAQWLIEAGIPGERIWSSQGFMPPSAGDMPLALRESSPTRNCDSGGVSIEGSKPRGAHLGAIVYGQAASNEMPMENGRPFYSTLAGIDPDFGIVEFNTADLRKLDAQPDYAVAYRALRDLWNSGARFVSPMAWNGSNGMARSDPGYAPHTAWRNTPLEDATLDFLLDRAGLPRGSRLWTFGAGGHADDDGWTAEAGALEVQPGGPALFADASGAVVLVSPANLQLDPRRGATIVFGLAQDAALKEIRVLARDASNADWVPIGYGERAALRRCSAGIALATRIESRLTTIDRLRVEIVVAVSPTAHPLRLSRIAVLVGAAR
jgi:hypothetical protein